jgi:hypothetical protein
MRLVYLAWLAGSLRLPGCEGRIEELWLLAGPVVTGINVSHFQIIL